MSTDPVHDADLHLQERHEEAERIALRQAFDAAEFQRELMERPLTEPTSLRWYDDSPGWSHHQSGLWELVSEIMDCSEEAPRFPELLAVVVRVANAGDAQAMSIIRRLATAYADLKGAV